MDPNETILKTQYTDGTNKKQFEVTGIDDKASVSREEEGSESDIEESLDELSKPDSQLIEYGVQIIDVDLPNECYACCANKSLSQLEASSLDCVDYDCLNVDKSLYGARAASLSILSRFTYSKLLSALMLMSLVSASCAWKMPNSGFKHHLPLRMNIPKQLFEMNVHHPTFVSDAQSSMPIFNAQTIDSTMYSKEASINLATTLSMAQKYRYASPFHLLKVIIDSDTTLIRSIESIANVNRNELLKNLKAELKKIPRLTHNSRDIVNKGLIDCFRQAENFRIQENATEVDVMHLLKACVESKDVIERFPGETGRLRYAIHVQREIISLEDMFRAMKQLPSVSEPTLLSLDNRLMFPTGLGKKEFVNNNLFVRQCHIDAWKYFITEVYMKTARLLIVGPSGIGKSWLASFLIVNCVKSNITVVYERSETGFVYVFSEDRCQKFTSGARPIEVTDANAVYIYDCKAGHQNNFFVSEANLIVISSNHEDNFTQLRRDRHSTFFVPSCSESEFNVYSNCFNLSENQSDAVKEQCGTGKVRPLGCMAAGGFSDYLTEVEAALKEFDFEKLDQYASQYPLSTRGNPAMLFDAFLNESCVNGTDLTSRYNPVNAVWHFSNKNFLPRLLTIKENKADVFFKKLQREIRNGNINMVL